MSSHSDTLSWLRADQSLLFLLNAACLAEKQQILIEVFCLTRSGLEPTIYHTGGEHANHYTNDAVYSNLIVVMYEQIFKRCVAETVTCPQTLRKHVSCADLHVR